MAATADAHSGILPLANRRPGLQHHRRRANSWPWEGANQQRILPFMVGSSSEPLCVGCSSAARATRGNAESLSPLRSSAVAGDSVASDIMTSEVIEDENQFYSKARTYWKRIPPTVDGMLGGYGHISNIDLNSSRKFLQRFLREGPNKTGTSCALDCGAGIGRITKRLLLPLFKVVDMVDVTEDFLAQAKTYLGEEGKRVRNYFCCGLQDFSPEPSSYDVIWIQWVIGHLTDQHLADFLRRCKRGLRPNGIIVIKDNMAQEGVILDDVDSSVCRDLEVVRRIIRSAGLSLLAEERQENLPDEIYHVYSFALR